jgi:chromosome segregation ATPase
LELETTKQEIAELVAQNASLQDRHDNLQIAHQQLIDNYEKLIDTRNYAITILKIGKKMKTERLRRDNFFENKIKSMTKHIKTLLVDRQQLLEQVQNLHRDNVILIDKLEGYYRCHDRYIENL